MITEIRLGNCIKHKDSDFYWEVTYEDLEYIYDNPNNYEGILLTAGWHKKFGVINNGFNSFEYSFKNKINLDLTVIFTDDYVMLRQGKSKSIDDNIVSIWNKDVVKRDMYVHEWQNLYRFLSGEELKTYIYITPKDSIQLKVFGHKIKYTERKVKTKRDLEIAINHFKFVERYV